MYITVNGNRIKHNMAFTLYFCLMFCLYTYTYIQLLVQVFLILYVVSPILQNKQKIKKNILKGPVKFYFLWYGLFTALMYCSQYWAETANPESKTMLTILRIFVMGLMIVYYAVTKEKMLSLLLSFIVGAAVMGCIAIISSIIFGDAIGTEEFGTVIGQHRNQIGAVAAPITILCYYLKRYCELKYGYPLACFFALLTLCTGSRTSILQIAVILCICILFEPNVSRAIQRIIYAFILLIILIILIQYIPYLYETIWLRLISGFKTIMGIEKTEGSALGRSYYKVIAFMMFKNKPFAGYGLDGFYCFLRDNPFIMGTESRLHPVPAHCNYAELAADFGILGLLIWYIPIIKVLHWGWKIRHQGELWMCVVAVFFSIVISDYSRVPWQTHLTMYFVIIIVSLIRFKYLEETQRSKVKNIN